LQILQIEALAATGPGLADLEAATGQQRGQALQILQIEGSNGSNGARQQRGQALQILQIEA